MSAGSYWPWITAPSRPGSTVRLVSLAYGLPLAYESIKWREMLRCTEFETATLDGMPTYKPVGGTYCGTSSKKSYMNVFCACKFLWSVSFCAMLAQAVAVMGYYVLSRRQLPCSCSPNTASGVTLYLGTTVQPLMTTRIAMMHGVQPSHE